MDILLIHQAFVSGREVGGTRHYELGQKLALKGDRLKVVASQVNYLTGQRVGDAPRRVYYRENVDGIEVLRAYAPPIHNKSFFWRVIAFLVFMATSFWAGLRSGPIDLVMGTTPPIFQATSAWLVARLRRKPFLLEIRDLWPDFAIEMGVLRSRVLIALSRWLEKFLYRHADHILVNSPAYRDYLMGKGVAADKVSLVANGVDVDMFDPGLDGAELRRRFHVEDKLLVVYAGAHGLANDLGTILDSAERLRDFERVHFLFVGDGKELPNLKAVAEQRGLANVTFVGTLPKDMMPEVLGAADLCVATLKDIRMFRTTYPNKIFDYMAAGRPTILAIDGVIRKVVEEAEGGVFVPPGDAEAMAEAIRRLAADPALRQRMGQSARRYVVEHFDRRLQAEEFRQVLARMTSGSRVGDVVQASTS